MYLYIHVCIYTIGDISVRTPKKYSGCYPLGTPIGPSRGSPCPHLCPQLSRMAPRGSMADQERNRALILEKHRASMSLGAIAKALNLSKSTVQYVIKQFKNRQSVTAKSMKGKPATLSKRVAHILPNLHPNLTSHHDSGTCGI